MPQKSIFENFTNLYSLTKTLRFELKPTEETKSLLQKTDNLGLTPVATDKQIDELYNTKLKLMFDDLHEKFINESLSNV
jgi:CRISPR-associated protein Cpf1